MERSSHFSEPPSADLSRRLLASVHCRLHKPKPSVTGESQVRCELLQSLGAGQIIIDPGLW